MRIRRRVPADAVPLTPVNASDAAFVFACVSFSVAALVLLLVGLSPVAVTL